MVGTTSKYPFFNSFIAGVLSVIVVGVLTFIGFFSWRYFRNRRRRLVRANNSIALTILEDGLKASDASDIPSRSPSRLGGIFPSSVKRADDARETQSQSLVQPGTTNSAGKRPVFVPPRSSSIIKPLTTKGVERRDDRTKRVEDSSNGTTWGNNGDTTTERAQPRSSAHASRPKMRPVPPVPLSPTSRLSASTVWSQESMWPREKKPDVTVPPLPHIPPLAHMQVPRRVTFSPDMASNQNRRSTSSLPRSVGQSDFEDYI